ncbi:MAG: phosphate/phosphite/phosphonate ABC transporter substrate-binding protein [Desulfobacteraceae bacterium]|nr:phosphate/phosphite/phosphonate ABC transporter substrate-binding protein [Desulfobacteraceae bacterium]
MNDHKSKKCFVVFSVFIFLASFAVLGGALSSAAEKEIKTISIAVIPFEEVQLTAKKFKGVVRALEEVTGKKVEWFFPTSYASLIESQRRGFIQIGYYGPRSYVDAHRVSGGMIVAFAQAMWGGGPYREKKPGYHSYLIVKADSPYQSVEDLKGKVLALTDPASTSGDLIPKVQLGKELGMKISKYFSKTFYAGGHDAAALSVLEGRAEVAAVADVTLDWAVDAKRFGPKDFRIIWKSTLLPLDPFAMRKDLPSDLKESIKKAFLHLNETDYGKKYLKAIRSDSIELCDDKAFDPIREAYKEMEKWE